MKSRIESLDYARGFTVLIMPTVHTVMVYSMPWIRETWLGIILAFLAEGPGAQLFMFVLGFSVLMGRLKNPHEIIKRSLILLFGGYLLNFLRLVLPFLAGVLTDASLEAYFVFRDMPAEINLLLTGDILQMAGIAYFIVQMINRAKHAILIATICFFVVAFVSPYLWHIRFDHVFADHVAGLFAAKDYRAFFPIFPWLCYPLAGFVAGKCYKSTTPKRFFMMLLVAGIILMITGLVLHVYWTNSQDADFYRAAGGRTVYQTGFVLLWLCMWHVFSKRLKGSIVGTLLVYYSKHISLIYILQWLIIGWGVYFAGYEALDMANTIVAIVIVNAITFLISRLVLQLTSKKPHEFISVELTLKQ